MFAAKILLDSIAPSGSRLTTYEVSFPRIVLAEFNTHRLFSRNSASSRAIPVEKMISKVLQDPFIPTHWGANQKGMQANQELSPSEQELAKEGWLTGAQYAVQQARRLAGLDGVFPFAVHKQITNRLIEPWLWHTVIVSATEWRNFLALRDQVMAQPEIQRPANMMRRLYLSSKPQMLAADAWHLPLVTGVDEQTLRQEGVSLEDLIKISCARCARVSYLTHDGKRSIQADLDLYTNLTKNGHMSPTEHAAQALDHQEWRRIAREQAHEWIENHVPVGNFHGFLQHRKQLPNEHEFPREDLFWKEAA